MFDYRALYEIQPKVSVDFLRVVQLCQFDMRFLFLNNQKIKWQIKNFSV